MKKCRATRVGRIPKSRFARRAGPGVGSADIFAIGDGSDHRHLRKRVARAGTARKQWARTALPSAKVPYRKIPEKARYKTKEITNISKIY